MKLLVGLGNPGEKYKNVRHNLGFEILDEFVKKMDGGGWKIGVEGGKWKMEEKFKAEIIKVSELLLVKPQTFVNKSGIAVSLIASYFKVHPEDVIIIHDELDLPLGKIKVRLGGSAAGHHGVESIIDALGTDQFVRVRLGIGRVAFAAEEFVLEPFLPDEKPQVNQMIKRAVKIIEASLTAGVEIARNQYP